MAAVFVEDNYVQFKNTSGGQRQPVKEPAVNRRTNTGRRSVSLSHTHSTHRIHSSMCSLCIWPQQSMNSQEIYFRPVLIRRPRGAITPNLGCSPNGSLCQQIEFHIRKSNKKRNINLIIASVVPNK